MNDIETSRMFVSVKNHSHTPKIMTTGNHCDISNGKFSVGFNFPSAEIKFHRVIHANMWIRITAKNTSIKIRGSNNQHELDRTTLWDSPNGSTVVRHNVGNSASLFTLEWVSTNRSRPAFGKALHTTKLELQKQSECWEWQENSTVSYWDDIFFSRGDNELTSSLA